MAEVPLDAELLSLEWVKDEQKSPQPEERLWRRMRTAEVKSR